MFDVGQAPADPAVERAMAEIIDSRSKRDKVAIPQQPELRRAHDTDAIGRLLAAGYVELLDTCRLAHLALEGAPELAGIPLLVFHVKQAGIQWLGGKRHLVAPRPVPNGGGRPKRPAGQLTERHRMLLDMLKDGEQHTGWIMAELERRGAPVSYGTMCVALQELVDLGRLTTRLGPAPVRGRGHRPRRYYSVAAEPAAQGAAAE